LAKLSPKILLQQEKWSQVEALKLYGQLLFVIVFFILSADPTAVSVDNFSRRDIVSSSSSARRSSQTKGTTSPKLQFASATDAQSGRVDELIVKQVYNISHGWN
jgi:hypothetical protein